MSTTVDIIETVTEAIDKQRDVDDGIDDEPWATPFSEGVVVWRNRDRDSSDYHMETLESVLEKHDDALLERIKDMLEDASEDE